MVVSLTDANGTGYAIGNPVRKKCLKKYADNLLSIPIAVVPQHLSENQRNAKKSSSGYTIQLLGTHENRAEVE